MLKEFQKFIARGNVMDMAVGIIMGAAFTAIVNSIVGDLVMPVIGVLTSGIDFSNMFLPLDGKAYPSLIAAKTAGASVISYGIFINAVVNFIVVSFVVFLLIKNINRLRYKQEQGDKQVSPPDVVLLKEIRDLLAQNLGK